MTDKIARFVSERWEPVSQFGGNELGDVHRETLQELGECAAEVDALRAQIAFLTIQRDAAEALAREAQTARDCAESYTKSVTAERNHLLDEVERVGKIADQADAVVASVVASSPIAGRWCLASERDEAVKAWESARESAGRMADRMSHDAPILLDAVTNAIAQRDEALANLATMRANMEAALLLVTGAANIAISEAHSTGIGDGHALTARMEGTSSICGDFNDAMDRARKLVATP